MKTQLIVSSDRASEVANISINLQEYHLIAAITKGVLYIWTTKTT
jgi:hypothetical protein